MKKIILYSVVVMVATAVCLIGNNKHVSDIVLSNVEALTAREGGDSGTCCYQESAQCKIGTVTIMNSERIDGGQACP